MTYPFAVCFPWCRVHPLTRTVSTRLPRHISDASPTPFPLLGALPPSTSRSHLPRSSFMGTRPMAIEKWLLSVALLPPSSASQQNLLPIPFPVLLSPQPHPSPRLPPRPFCRQTLHFRLLASKRGSKKQATVTGGS